MKYKNKILLALFLMVVLVFSLGITYSIFHTESELDTVDQKIAKFVFEAEQFENIELPLTNLNPGDSKEYQFSVKNGDLGNVSNVTINYQISIKTFHLMPINIELYKIGETEQLIMTCDEHYTRNSENQLICNSEVQEMLYNSEVIDNYKMKIVFPSNYNLEDYADLVDYVDLEIKSWQKMGTVKKES